MLVQYSLGQNQVFPIRHRDDEWIFRKRMGKLSWSILPPPQYLSSFPSCSLPLLSLLPCLLILEPSPYFTILPVLLVLDKTGFFLLSSLAFPLFIFWREGQKEDEGLKVCGGKFLEDVSGLCSQGTSCSQCEHGTLSMRSISMTIIFILQQSGSRQHSTTGEKKVLLPIRYTLCNIFAVNTNKVVWEKIMTRYQPAFLPLKIPMLA